MRRLVSHGASWATAAPETLALLCVAAVLGVACGENGTPTGDCGNGICDSPPENYLNCPADCYGICQNGVLDPDEECDGSDYGGAQCQDHGCGHGELGCSNTCEIIVSGCGSPCGEYCGDGVREAAEQCDCGADPDELPDLCAAPNGHLLSVCDVDCTWKVTCGNQVVDAGEECDCGIDPDNLPTGCTLPNGFAEGECNADCIVNEGSCFVSLTDSIMCDPTLTGPQCCGDGYGHAAKCVQVDTNEAWCLMYCQTTADCHFNHNCDSIGSTCFPTMCGPSLTGESYYGVCQVPGGRDGICLPITMAEDDIGQCLENSQNAISPREPCFPAHLQVSFPRDEAMDTCYNGVCLDWTASTDPVCLSVCDWQDVYDNETNASWCAWGTNCIAESYIVPDHPDPALRGKRQADLSYCRPTRDEDDLWGVTACDLVNDELIADRTQVCTDWRSNTHCRPSVVTESGVDAISWGSLIGNCLDDGTTAVGKWQICDPATDECAPNTACFPEDAFAASPAGPHRCVPLCDTNDPTPCAPLHPVVPATNVCTSLSAHFRPGTSPGSSDDGAPSRVGLCALVPL